MKEEIASEFWSNVSRIWKQEVMVPPDIIFNKDITIAEKLDGVFKTMTPAIGVASALIQTIGELNKISPESMYIAPAIDNFFKSCKEALKDDELAAGLGSIIFPLGAGIDGIISEVTGEKQAGFSRGFISNLLDIGNGLAQLVVDPIAAVSGLSQVASNPHTTLDNLLGQICGSFNDSVINGTPEEAAEWFGYATVEVIGLLITGDEIAKSLKAPSAAAAAGLGDNLVDDAASAAGKVVNNIDELDDAARAIDIVDDISGKSSNFISSDTTIYAIKNNGMEITDFENLKHIPTEQLTPMQKETLKTIRESIPAPTADTLMSKTIPKEAIASYLDGSYGNRVGGFVSKADDVSGLTTSHDIFEGLRLDYSGTTLDPNESFFVLEFKTIDTNQIKVPYDPNMGGSVIQDYPFTGNGFTSSTNGTIIPEFKSSNLLEMESGATIYEVSPNGSKKPLYVLENEKFISIE